VSVRICPESRSDGRVFSIIIAVKDKAVFLKKRSQFLPAYRIADQKPLPSLRDSAG
jgi:hypothetical protein